ncbi:MAG TPA: hypothetical protein VF252_02435 [Gemmatimonadales bacterium]
MTRAQLAALAGVLGMALATPPALASQEEADSIVVHWIDAGGPLRQLLSGVAAGVKGAFVPEEAERVHREAWDLSAPARYSSHPQQIERSYSYLARVRHDRQSILGIGLLTTHPRRFDVRFKSTADIIKAIRKVVPKQGPDSLAPIDRVRLVLKEEKAAYQPRLVLTIETVRQYSCRGYSIDYDLRQDADTLRVNLHGVGSTPGPCPAAVGPALLSRELRLNHRDHTVYISHGKRTDWLFFHITDSTLAVTSRESTLVEADQRLRLRYPRNSFAFRCGNPARAGSLCKEVDEWLAQQHGITRYSFPDSGINPYQARGARADEAFRFFSYDTPRSFEYLRLCFDALDNGNPAGERVALTLEDWVGNTMTANAAAGKDSAGRYSHRDVLGHVARIPVCRPPSGREESLE